MALADLAKILELVSSKSSTSSTTSGKTLTAEQVQALIKKTLEGTQGLASITGGEKAAGLYNSTVASQLTNDLVSSAAAEAAAQSTASTSTTTQSTPATVNPLLGLGLLGASGLLQNDNVSKVKDLISSWTGSSEVGDGTDFLTANDTAMASASGSVDQISSMLFDSPTIAATDYMSQLGQYGSDFSNIDISSWF